MSNNKFSNYPNGFPNGVTIRGVPILNTHSGHVFWVDYNNGSDGNNGTYGKPYKTIDYAIGQCSANRGDVILVKAGHAETVAAAAGIDCDVEGISIIGLGNGDNRPRITFSATGSDIDIDADNITLKNLIFDATAAVTATIDVNAAYFTMEDCLFVGSAAAQTHKIPIITDANANDMCIDNVSVQLLVADDGTTSITTTSSEAVRLVGADRAVVKNCYFSGDFTTSAINAITTACKDIQILNNRINNIATENIAGGIDLVAASTGYIDGNMVYVDYATSNVALIDASSCVIGLNYVSNEAGELPVLFGTLEAGDVEYQVSQILSEVGSVGTAAGSVGTQASVILSEVGSVATKVGSVGTQASTILSEVGSVATKVGSVGTQASTILSEVGSTATGVGSVGTITSTVLSEVGSVATKVGSVGTQASTVLSEVGSVGTGTGSVGTQVSTVLSEIGSLYTFLSTRLSIIDSQVS